MIGRYELGRLPIAQIARRFVVQANVGTFAVTGQDVALKYQASTELAAGTFAVTGQDISARYTMPLAVGSFTVSGQAVTVARTLLPLVCGAGSFTVTGRDVNLRGPVRLSLAAGSFTVTGRDVGLKHLYSLALAAGSFTVSGQTVALTYPRRLLCSPYAGVRRLNLRPLGAYALGQIYEDDRRPTFKVAGQDLGFRVVMPLEVGSYTITWQQVRGAQISRRVRAFPRTGRGVPAKGVGHAPIRASASSGRGVKAKAYG